jgi:hypothetical protein
MNRSGSMALNRVCRRLAMEAELTHISANPGDVSVGMGQFASEPEKWLSQKRSSVGPIRFFVSVPDIDTARILLHLRDPRDVLVSMFFSYCFYHPGKEAPGEGKRAEVAERGIDNFVLDMAQSTSAPIEGDYGTQASMWDVTGNIRQRYDNYLTQLYGRPNTVFVRYEDMILDPSAWLTAVAEAYECRSKNLLQGLENNILSAPAPSQENKSEHRRQVLPEDFRRKLDPVTIETLNDIFGPVLEAFNYPD